MSDVPHSFARVARKSLDAWLKLIGGHGIEYAAVVRQSMAADFPSSVFVSSLVDCQCLRSGMIACVECSVRLVLYLR